MTSPRITVFMAVYNRADVVRGAIDSVLAQTFGDFELLVIDDGSTDGSAKIVDSYADPRVRLVVHDRNQGIPRTRNEGLDLARGEYLAILDSDDYAYPRRLERQVDFLDRRPEIAAVGSWAVRMSPKGKARTLLIRVTDPREIRAHILYVSCFKNPTMTARTDVLRAYRYREAFSICQDIDLWSRVSADHPLANLPEFLVRYRSGGSSHGDTALTREMRIRVIRDQLEALEIEFDEADLDLHERLRNLAKLRPDAEFLDRSAAWLTELVVTNRRKLKYPEPEFTRATAERWLLLNAAAARAGVLPRPLAAPVLRSELTSFVRTYALLGLDLLKAAVDSTLAADRKTARA